ncbi:uncharacterized protein RSE6_01716 [Rhynchosporium secalis]|uniref:Uncharacterized protein n=1 Tax=Rhynchosporium secalis TaxID=38038 RepID=A0A1E1M039_RHYSE|nr:uncharacterized protein RSE6_01716 [Rhynchosporium secalis]
MASKSIDEVSPSSEPGTPTPTQCSHPRSRSATMIPYMSRSVSKEVADARVSSPGSRPLSPFPYFSSEEAAALQAEDDNLRLEVPSVPVRPISPFPNLPYVTDAASLQLAVSKYPDRIFDSIQNLVHERDALRNGLIITNNELKSVADDLANTRVDHKAARHRYEELFRVASAKQVILWKYIESLHSQLAVLNRQPDSNVGAGNGLGLYMGVRGGAGMGVAMEKWISEGVDCDRASRNGEEGSEKGTEHSFWSTDGSLGTRSLDPSAVSADLGKHIFIPHIESPQKFQQRSPTKAHNHETSPVSSIYYAVQDPFRNRPQPQWGPQPMVFPAISQQAHMPPHSLMAPLSPRWYGICPHSLAECSPCPLGVNCQFVPLCPRYNAYSGDGCASFNKGGKTACRFAHEYRFCEDVIANKKGGCVWEQNMGKAVAKMPPGKKGEAWHMRMRVHRSQIHDAEWDSRVLLLSMREAHARGIFNGQQITRGRTLY